MKVKDFIAKLFAGILGNIQSEKGVLALLIFGECSYLLIRGCLTSTDFRWIILGTAGALFTAHTISDVSGGNDSDKKSGLDPFPK